MCSIPIRKYWRFSFQNYPESNTFFSITVTALVQDTNSIHMHYFNPLLTCPLLLPCPCEGVLEHSSQWACQFWSLFQVPQCSQGLTTHSEAESKLSPSFLQFLPYLSRQNFQSPFTIMFQPPGACRLLLKQTKHMPHPQPPCHWAFASTCILPGLHSLRYLLADSLPLPLQFPAWLILLCLEELKRRAMPDSQVNLNPQKWQRTNEE